MDEISKLINRYINNFFSSMFFQYDTSSLYKIFILLYFIGRTRSKIYITIISSRNSE